MEKQEIIDEIRRTALANNGKPLGLRRFAEVTGIRDYEFIGVHWVKWGDAVAEAGFAPNEPPELIDPDEVCKHLAILIRDLGHFPSLPELRIRKADDENFPNKDTIRRRLGNTREQRAAAIVAYCHRTSGNDDVLRICEPLVGKQSENGEKRGASISTGFVYLMKSGRFYKIGRSDAPGRREYDLVTHRPEGVEIVHTIKTDDPEGIEAYWHNRFRDKRKRGEWFDLTREDVTAFKRWVRIH